MMAKLTKCPSCNNEMPSWAKNCPTCGVKVKKPFYKTGWFIAISIFIVIGMIGSAGSGDDVAITDNETTTIENQISENQIKKDQVEEKEEKEVPTEFKSALRSAKTYSDMMHMSKAGLYDQLISEYGDQFTKEEAQYAIDNLE